MTDEELKLLTNYQRMKIARFDTLAQIMTRIAEALETLVVLQGDKDA